MEMIGQRRREMTMITTSLNKSDLLSRFMGSVEDDNYLKFFENQNGFELIECISLLYISSHSHSPAIFSSMLSLFLKISIGDLEMVAFFVSNRTDTNCPWSIVQWHALHFFLLFLSTRAIVQAYLTRNFLINLKQVYLQYSSKVWSFETPLNY
ncbi:hypothetical protein Ahy_A09g043956 [Arachis hypogaea]|uniref:Uncharacterized protein n=1 Tax=Arachis hypogaea TaxID=3818 RepID=A0A445BJC2_ARAHY|nr:hypothetical protein Ahy_A09g043956 [Arachis hypogaea]